MLAFCTLRVKQLNLIEQLLALLFEESLLALLYFIWQKEEEEAVSNLYE